MSTNIKILTIAQNNPGFSVFLQGRQAPRMAAFVGYQIVSRMNRSLIVAEKPRRSKIWQNYEGWRNAMLKYRCRTGVSRSGQPAVQTSAVDKLGPAAADLPR